MFSIFEWPRRIWINSAWKDEVLHVTTSEFQSGEQACTSVCRYLELYGPTCLTLGDRGSRPDFRTTNQTADLQLNKITASQLAVDCKIKQCSVSNPLLAI